MDNPQLLPCPFCGNATRMCPTPHETFQVLCPACGTLGGAHLDRAEAAEHWNRRVSPSPAPALATDARDRIHLCPVCHGDGTLKIRNGVRECPECKGSATVSNPTRNIDLLLQWVSKDPDYQRVVEGQMVDAAACELAALKSVSGQATSQNALLSRDGWMCEAHPGTEWPHGDCAGPGMPWMVEGKDAVRALAASGQAARAALQAMRAACFSEQEARLCLIVGNGPGMTDGSENAKALHARCDRIAAAFKLADAALSSPPPRTTEKTP